MMITGAIFDVDGVLLDSMPVWEHTGEWYLASAGMTAAPDLAEKLFTLSLMEGAEYMKKTYELPQSCQEIIDGVNAMVEDFYFHKAVCKPGIRELLEYFSQNSVKLIVATATDKYLVEAALKRNGIFDYFTGVLTCSEVGAGKKKPDIFLAAKNKIGTDIEKTWIFEDSLHAIRTAKQAGFPVCGVYDPANKKDWILIREESNLYVKDFLEDPFSDLFLFS